MKNLKKTACGRTQKNSLFSTLLIYSVLSGFCLSVLSTRFLDVSQLETSPFWSDLYFYFYSWSYYSIFSIVVLLPSFLLALASFRKLAKILAILSIFGLLTLFLADTFVYQQFRLHLNLAMLQMTFFGGGQIVQFTNEMIVEIVALTVTCFFVSIFVWRVSRFLTGRQTKSFVLIVMGLTVSSFVLLQGVYGVSFAKHISEITRVNSLLPWNYPIRFNKLLIKAGLLNKDEVYTFKPGNSKLKMNYPLHSLNCEGGSEYNIVFLFVDSLRYDMLDPMIMPNTYEFSKKSTVFTEHFSGGINTRHGIFSLFTGLPGSYWEKSLETKSGSAFVSALQQRNYEIGIFTGATITMPEFNQTVFATVRNPRLYSRGNTTLERDEAAVSDFETWLTQLPKDKKFFTFVFLDAVHASAFPETPENEVFKPYWKSVNQLELTNTFDPTSYFNRYKNSVHYVDKQIGRMLERLGKTVDMNRTIVVISSDHGEEFNDNKLNYWGHNGNFTKYQAQIPFIVKWPGKDVPEVKYRTSALDVVPTILPEVLGCKNPTSDYSVGINLFKPEKKRDWLYVSNYSRNAFLEQDRIILINEFGILEYLDPHYRPSSNKKVPPYLKEILEETTKFLK